MAIQTILIGTNSAQELDEKAQQALRDKHENGTRPIDYSYRLGAAINPALCRFLNAEFDRSTKSGVGIDGRAFAEAVGMAAASLTATVMLSLTDDRNGMIVGKRDNAFELLCKEAASAYLPTLMITCNALKKPSDESAH